MRIAIPMADGKLCPHFGHCEKFALIDVDTESKKISKRESIPAPEHQPGLLPRWLHELGANVIIAGGMGQHALDLFAKNGIRVVTGAPSDEPEKLVNAFMNNALATGDNVCDH